jgi:hypothetical protein
MRAIVGVLAVDDKAASTSQMARFAKGILASDHNRHALATLTRQRTHAICDAQPPKWITLDMDISVSPNSEDQEGTA